jgi:anti-sigma factor RsiW
MSDHLDDVTLNEYLDAALPADRMAAAETHLAGCRDCAARLSEQRALFAALEALPDEPLARDLSADVLARLRQARSPHWNITRLARAVFAFQALSALILLLTISAIGLRLPFSLVDWSPRQMTSQLMMEAMIMFSTDWLALQAALQNTWGAGLAMTSQLMAPSVAALPTLSWAVGLVALGLLWLVSNGLLLSHRDSSRKNT